MADRAAAELQHHVVPEEVQQLVHLTGVDAPEATGITLRRSHQSWSKKIPRGKSWRVKLSRHTL